MDDSRGPKSRRTRNERGFSLTEVMLSVVLLGVLALLVGNFFDNIVSAFGFGSKLASYEREARGAIDRMQRELRAAHSPDVNAADVLDRWPVRFITPTEIQFFKLDRDDTDMLYAVRYWVDDTEELLYRSAITMEEEAPRKWIYPGDQPPTSDDWDANKEVVAQYVINEYGIGTDRPLFWDPVAANDPDAACAGAPEDGATNPLFQSVHICLSVDQDLQERPKPFALRAIASWRNPASSDQSGDDPAAQGDFNLFAVKAGVTATNGSQTWGASWNCTYYGNGCVKRGDRLRYRITYGNNFGSRAVDGTLVDSLDAKVSFVSATAGGLYDPVDHSVVWDDVAFDGGAANAEDVEVTVEVRADAQLGADIFNSATLTITKYQYGSQIKTTNQVADSNVTEHTIAIPLPDLQISATDSVPSNYVDVGTTNSYTVTVTNVGDGPATGVSIFTRKYYGGSQYSFSTDQRCVSASQGDFLGCDMGSTGPETYPRQWVYDVGQIDPGETVQATIFVELPTVAPWNARGCPNRDIWFRVSSNEESTEQSGVQRWSLRPCNEGYKTRYQSDASPGQWVDYRLRLRNRYTNTPLTSVVFEDDLDGNGNYGWNVSATPQWTPLYGGVNCSYNGTSHKLTCTLASFPASPGSTGYTDIVRVSFRISGSASCDVRNRFKVWADLSQSRDSNYEYISINGGAGCGGGTTTTSTTGGGTTTTTTTTTSTTTTTTTTTRPGGV